MNPTKLGGVADHRQEPWKVPLPQFIEELYVTRFKKERPDNVRSIEQMVKDKKRFIRRSSENVAKSSR